MTPVLKIQKIGSFSNVNSYAPAMMGYIFKGLQLIESMPVKCFMDRSPLNTLEWYILWKFMYIYNQTFGNVDPHTVDCSNFLQEFDRVFANLKIFYAPFRSKIDVLAIIDSDTERCDDKRLRRNHGTDPLRSQWKYYTYLQNRMYRNLYNCIDLCWFDYTIHSKSAIIDTIAKHLKELLMSRPIEPVRYFKAFPLPATLNMNDDGTDYTLANYNTHLYRQAGRVSVARILNRQYDSVDENLVLPVRRRLDFSSKRTEPDEEEHHDNNGERTSERFQTLYRSAVVQKIKVTTIAEDDDTEYNELMDLYNDAF